MAAAIYGTNSEFASLATEKEPVRDTNASMKKYTSVGYESQAPPEILFARIMSEDEFRRFSFRFTEFKPAARNAEICVLLHECAVADRPAGHSACVRLVRRGVTRLQLEVRWHGMRVQPGVSA